MKLQDSIDKIQHQLDEVDHPEFDRVNFLWGDLQYQAQRQTTGKKSIIHLKTKLGRLYYSAENAELRNEAIKTISILNKTGGTMIQVTKNGNISYETVTTVEPSNLGAELLSAVTMILLSVQNQVNNLRPLLKSL